MGNGYSFALFKSNFTSTINTEFSIKANHFDNCHTEQDVKDEVENLMEIKFPIHTRRRAGIKPTLCSNEDASSFMKQVLVNLYNAKMVQCHWENLLTHLILNCLPYT